MKIYFAGSIRGGRRDRELYARIINFLKTYGVILTEHIGNNELSRDGENYLSDPSIYKRDMDFIRETDVLIAEVTTPSLGVGYEIGKAEELNKPILCLYRKNSEKNLSAMISGNDNVKIGIYEKIDDAFQIIDDFLRSLNIINNK